MELRPILSTLLRKKTGPFLIAAQVAISLAILANALYIIRDRLAISARPSGVADESSVFRIQVASVETPKDIFGLMRREIELLRALPGVKAVSTTSQMPMGNQGSYSGLSRELNPHGAFVFASIYFSSKGFLDTLGMRLVEGRDFREEEVEDVDFATSDESGRYAIVTRALGAQLYPGETSFVGKTVVFDDHELRIVGVVDLLQTNRAEVSQTGELSLIIGMHAYRNAATYAVRTEPGQMPRLMREAAELLANSTRDRVVVQNRSSAEDRARRYRNDRALASMLATLSVLLMLVTGSGVVGMASLWVNQRRKQIGVRRALGARRLDILRYFIVENLLITSAGVCAGAFLAIALNQFLVSHLELTKLPLHYVGIGAALLWVLGILAVYGPAGRAASILPAVATRST